ncbi:galactoside 2-alpha-L-fucosyltransferase 2-like [Pomacea canaliculata]|uniref:galactoside 2-alpha-L-fucosyltransferase 2-like n=1 Tax=Pomacea canaliculata TaxID=400727 RepID=UPI000D73BD0D|nr:galactoside 2-alpha-L-fucosyltransferase 2-like [Pomacea canaliculata]
MRKKKRYFVGILCVVLALVVFVRRHYVVDFTPSFLAPLANSDLSIQSGAVDHDQDSSTNVRTRYPTTSSILSINNQQSENPEYTSIADRKLYQLTSLSYPLNSCAGGWEFPSSSTPPSVTNTTTTTASLDSINGSKVICARDVGRLGNQMFEYASIIGIALKTNRTPVFLGMSSTLHDVLQNTSIIENSVKYSNQCEENFVQEPACCKFFPRFIMLDPNKNYRIGHYIESWRYFFEYEAEIREAMKFKDSIVTQASKVVDSLRQKHNRTLTGIHVRRGDYLYIGFVGYKTAPVQYLVHAMDYVRQRFRDVTFVISSDDVEWCKEQFANTSDVTVLQANSPPAVDMMILASLDHMIMTVGSYGWWASFLNPGITVYYRDFVEPGTFLSGQFSPNGTDYYCPTWIALS